MKHICPQRSEERHDSLKEMLGYNRASIPMQSDAFKVHTVCEIVIQQCSPLHQARSIDLVLDLKYLGGRIVRLGISPGRITSAAAGKTELQYAVRHLDTTLLR